MMADRNPILDDQDCSIREVDHVAINDSSSVDSNEVVSTSKWRSILTLAILTTINLLNYMDRFTVAALLEYIKKYYAIENDQAGLLQTVFIIAYMLLSPVFGLLGDRGEPNSWFGRKWIMLYGIVLWSGITLASSYIPENLFALFMLMRCLVGIGEASYSTVSPPIIADLFVGDARTIALIVFNLAVPAGSGLGYIVGSQVARLTVHFNHDGRPDNWQWGLRVTPILGLVCVLLLIFVFREPARGQAEHATHMHSTSIREDLKQLIRNKSFVFNALGFTGVSFVAGALSWWSPFFLDKAVHSSDQFLPTLTVHSTSLFQFSDAPMDPDQIDPTIALMFGVVTCIAGIAGVSIGAEVARRLRSRVPTADPLVCGIGLLLSVPFLYFALLLSHVNIIVTYVLIFFGETMLCLTWALVNEINLKVTVPTRRAIATSLNILCCHLLGDAASPWLIGFISKSLANNQPHPDAPATQYLALQNALFSCCFIAIIGGAAFLACTKTYVQDVSRVLRIEQAAMKFYAQEGASYTPEDSLADLSVHGSDVLHR